MARQTPQLLPICEGDSIHSEHLARDITRQRQRDKGTRAHGAVREHEVFVRFTGRVLRCPVGAVRVLVFACQSAHAARVRAVSQHRARVGLAEGVAPNDALLTVEVCAGLGISKSAIGHGVRALLVVLIGAQLARSRALLQHVTFVGSTIASGRPLRAVGLLVQTEISASATRSRAGRKQRRVFLALPVPCPCTTSCVRIKTFDHAYAARHRTILEHEVDIVFAVPGCRPAHTALVQIPAQVIAHATAVRA